MGYKVVILTRESKNSPLETIAWEQEVDLINVALEEITKQVNGLIPKKIIEDIFIITVRD